MKQDYPFNSNMKGTKESGKQNYETKGKTSFNFEPLPVADRKKNSQYLID